MSRIGEIVGSSAILAAAFAACIGTAAIWANPKRWINQLFFTASIHVSIWLILRYASSVGQDLSLYRVTTALGALMHFHLWLIKEAVIGSVSSLREAIFRGGGKWWLIAGVGLAAVCFTEWFIPTPLVKGGAHQYRSGFFVYGTGLAALFLLLAWQTGRQMKLLHGVRRIELQLLLLGGTGAATFVVLLMILRSIWGAGWTSSLVPYVILILYAATVIGITTSKVFDARQLLLVVFHRGILVLLVSCAAALLGLAIEPLFSEQVTILVIIAFSLWVAGIVRRSLDRFLQYYPRDGSARQAVLVAAQEERRVERLEETFRSILVGWGRSERSLLESYPKRSAGDAETVSSRDEKVLEAMRSLRWATPERLNRERDSVGRAYVSNFLTEHQLGALVVEDGLTLSVLVGVGVAASRRPYTYPQVADLMEICSIMGSALERAHFSAKVQHTEQLATVGLLGASLAHEIRNPLVTIKTFVQLLPQHYSDPKFRDKFFKLMLDEVGRIDQLTDQLLDLASPKAYLAQPINLHDVIRESLDLVAAKANHRQVELIADLRASPDQAFTDASAAKQVALNLCFNAIHAVENHGEEARWIRVSTRNVPMGIEMVITDSGPGISPEIRPRLFQPFQTTKSSGFGLGLAICSDILANLNASICVDPHEMGKGATFRVKFPCQPT